jgi:hypothetical protein
MTEKAISPLRRRLIEDMAGHRQLVGSVSGMQAIGIGD